MDIETLGPYRIDKRLGAGGMGEVFRAWDDRLERSVAIKLVRPEKAHDLKVHQRFLREAKATARLNHPSIVQVFDILELDEGAAIVMEWIDGVTLSQAMRADRPELAVALGWGRDVAAGLREAHRQGIVHRDLKAENVMLTRSGQIKILDFGLAKPMADDIGEGGLSMSGELRGTLHAMSPEQAQGFEVDPRSDLFSLGTLLYEMVTGEQPFRAATPLATLSRVVSFRPPSAAELDPQTPAEVSDLIAQLMEKDPDHRPQSAESVETSIHRLQETSDVSDIPASVTARATETRQAPLSQVPTWGPEEIGRPSSVESPELRVDPDDAKGKRSVVLLVGVAVALGAVMALIVAWQWSGGDPAPESTVTQPLRVAITRPTLSADPGTLAEPEMVIFAMRRAASQSLGGLAGVAPLSVSDTDTVVDGWATSRGRPNGIGSADLARALAADEILDTRLVCAGARCSAAFTRIVGDGVESNTREMTVPIDDLRRLFTLVSQNLRHLYPGHPVEEGPDLAVTPADYEEYVRVRLSHDRSPTPGETYEQLLLRLERIQTGSPRFLDAVLLEAEVARQQFDISRDREHLDRALHALSRARVLAPEDPQALFEAFNLHYRARQWRKAEDAVVELERLSPGDPAVLMPRAWLLLEQGKPKDAIELATTATRLLPSWRLHNNLATLLYKVGNMDAARDEVTTALELFPANLKSLSLAAEIASVGGRREALDLYETLVELRPDAVREWWNFGTTHLLFGNLDQADRCFETVRRLAPGAWRVLVSQGDAAYLRRQDEAAQAFYLEALRLGSAEHGAATSGWTQLALARANAGLGRQVDAAMALREALKILGKRAEQPFLAYQAATVHALLNDQTSALAGSKEALDKGMSSRWFRLRWFDTLQEVHAFRQLLLQADSQLEMPAEKPDGESL